MEQYEDTPTTEVEDTPTIEVEDPLVYAFANESLSYVDSMGFGLLLIVLREWLNQSWAMIHELYLCSKG